VAAFAVQVVLRLHSEEQQHRAEPVLAGAVSRVGWALGHTVVAAVGSSALLAIAGAASGLAHGVREHDVAHQVVRLVAASLLQWPAVAVMAAATLLLHGALPRLATTAWALLGAWLLLGQLGPLLKLGHWVMDLSPFTHLPTVPGGAIEAAPLVGLCVVAAVVGGLGLAALRRRDLLG
jgi:ABC-2 type transport system permease protein